MVEIRYSVENITLMKTQNPKNKKLLMEDFR